MVYKRPSNNEEHGCRHDRDCPRRRIGPGSELKPGVCVYEEL